MHDNRRKRPGGNSEYSDNPEATTSTEVSSLSHSNFSLTASMNRDRVTIRKALQNPMTKTCSWKYTNGETCQEQAADLTDNTCWLHSRNSKKTRNDWEQLVSSKCGKGDFNFSGAYFNDIFESFVGFNNADFSSVVFERGAHFPRARFNGITTFWTRPSLKKQFSWRPYLKRL
jgi:hypothetical protein